MKPFARFITRGSTDNGKSGSPDLGLMMFYKGQQEFSPNSVYEIADIMGVPGIRYVGEANSQINWGQDISRIVDQQNKFMIVSKREFEQLAAAGKLGQLGY